MTDECDDAVSLTPREIEGEPVADQTPDLMQKLMDSLHDARQTPDPIDVIAEALDRAWNDFVADTGNFPDCIDVYEMGNDPWDVRLSADFRSGNFSSMAANWLTAAGFRVVPVVDDATRQEVEVLLDRYSNWANSDRAPEFELLTQMGEMLQWLDLRGVLAAAYLGRTD